MCNMCILTCDFILALKGVLDYIILDFGYVVYIFTVHVIPFELYFSKYRPLVLFIFCGLFGL